MKLLREGPKRAPLIVALAHGAGASMDTPFMNFFAEGLAARGYGVARFEFPYMAARRANGPKKPPDRQPVLLDTWREVIAEIGANSLVIGGKSMGGRMASLIADEMQVRGLVCLGYPFYGMGNKDKPRIEHLLALKTPTLICQGERDPMGAKHDISKLTFPKNVRLHWLPDGDHDLKPRKASGFTHEQNLHGALDAVAAFLAALA
jgi:predicted alpha/beta-hydrolase family hydrolase